MNWRILDLLMCRTVLVGAKVRNCQDKSNLRIRISTLIQVQRAFPTQEQDVSLHQARFSQSLEVVHLVFL